MFKPIVGYEGIYEIDEYGTMRNIKTGKVFYGSLGTQGYIATTLRDANGKKKTEKVHRLVATAFCFKPEGCDVVNHLDEDKTNNYYKNLEWTTIAKNNSWGTRLTRAANTHKHTIKIYDKNNNLVGIFQGNHEAAEAMGVSSTTIINWKKGKHKSKDGYKIVVGGDE